MIPYLSETNTENVELYFSVKFFDTKKKKKTQLQIFLTLEEKNWNTKIQRLTYNNHYIGLELALQLQHIHIPIYAVRKRNLTMSMIYNHALMPIPIFNSAAA